MAGVVVVTLVALTAFDIGAVTIMRRNLLGQTDGNLRGVLQVAGARLCHPLGAPSADHQTGSQEHHAAGAATSAPAAGAGAGAAGCSVSSEANHLAGAAGGGPAGPLQGKGSPFQVPVSVYGVTYVAANGGQVQIQAAASGGQQPLWTLVPTAALLAAEGAPHAVTVSADGTQVRADSLKVAGGTLVAGTSLSQVNQTIDYIGLVVAAGSGIVLILVGLGVYLVLRRGLRPIEAMATQAERITAGDLTQRVSSHHPRSEVGRLGTALNGMLARIEASVDERAAGERQMRRFFADASHELRTPLASLRANAELYQQGVVSGGPELGEVMRRITLESQRMSRLVDDMFRLARLGAQPSQAQEPVDLTALVESCADRALVAEPERTWHVQVAPGLRVAGDEELLRRAIDNLIMNVHVHTAVTTTGTITAAVAGDSAGSADDAASAAGGDGRVVIEVSDDGPGVPADRLPHIFERFYRAGAASRPGSGLGLAIASEIAAAHGGRATATPNSPAGLRVTIELPRLAAQEAAVTPVLAGRMPEPPH